MLCRRWGGHAAKPLLILLAGVSTGTIWRGGHSAPLIPPRTRQRAEVGALSGTRSPHSPCGGAKVPLEPRIWAVGRPRDLAKWQSPRPWELGAFPLPTVPPAVSGRLGHGTSCAAPGPDTAAARRGAHPTEAWVAHSHPFLEPLLQGVMLPNFLRWL